METDNSIIIGERHPMIGNEYTYTLRVPHITERWEIWRGNQCLQKKGEGKFTFWDASLNEGFVIRSYYRTKESLTVELSASYAVKTLPGKPEFMTISWQDVNLEDIGDRRVEYLDDIHLTVRTANIPRGERLSAKIIDSTTGSEGNEIFAYVNDHYIVRFKVKPELLKHFAKKASTADFLHETSHDYYAKIRYFNKEFSETKQGTVQYYEEIEYYEKIEESKKLTVTNVAGQAIAPKNSLKPLVIDKDNPNNDDKDLIELKLNVFFDGTKNNMTNVQARKHVADNTASSDEADAYKRYGGEGKDVSYEQGLSNVALLYDNDEFNEENKKKKGENDPTKISIYIEGVGTTNLQGDIVFPDQSAGRDVKTPVRNFKAQTGIEKKINLTMNFISDKTTRATSDAKKDVDKALYNVFGFSRGAATARYFVWRKPDVAFHTNSIAEEKIVFKFVGLFDTVAAYGWPWNFKHNVAELHLAMGRNVEKVVQLQAGDEYRANFPLVNIKSSIDAGVGYQFKMPGAHCDIGGGYKDKVDESARGDKLFINKLIEQGWYSEKSKKNITPFNPIYTVWRVSRTVNNKYQYIALKIMGYFAEEYGEMKFIKKINNLYEIASNDEELGGYCNILYSQAIGKYSIYKLPLEKEKELRKYLHLSACREGAENKTTDKIPYHGKYNNNDEPDREIFEG